MRRFWCAELREALALMSEHAIALERELTMDERAIQCSTRIARSMMKTSSKSWTGCMRFKPHASL